MPLLAIPFPFTDPNAPFAIPPFAIGPLTIAIRWYAIAYIAGLLIGWRYCLVLADRPPPDSLYLRPAPFWTEPNVPLLPPLPAPVGAGVLPYSAPQPKAQ